MKIHIEHLIHEGEISRPYTQINEEQIYFMNQKHTNEIFIFDKNSPSTNPHDGILTIEEGNYVIYTADCVPVVIDFGKGAVLLHSGWKGTILNIIPKAFELIQKEFGIEKKDCSVYVGPHISEKVYEIVPLEKGGDGRELQFIEEFGEESIKKVEGKIFLDLKYCILKQCKGVKKIEYNPLCTFTDNELPSYYKDKSTQRLLTKVTLKKIP